MSMRLDCFELEFLNEDEESVRSVLSTAVHEGKPIKAYSGLYFNKWYKNLQFIVGTVINEDENKLEIVSSDAHCAGMCTWKCRVKDDITPKDYSGMEMRLLVEALPDDEHEYPTFTVVDVMNADILPSFAPGEIIELQVIAKAEQIGLYADEKAFIDAEGEKVKLPVGDNGGKEEQTLTIAEGYPMPGRFLKNHTYKAGEEPKSAEFTDDDKWVYLRGKIQKTATYSAIFPKNEDREEVRWILPTAPVKTYYGDIDIMFNPTWISEEQKKEIEAGWTISTVCEIQGDPLLYEYEEGMVIDAKNNMMAVRYALCSGKIRRLLPILADKCSFFSETHQMEIVGKEEIIQYLEEKYRYITEEVHNKEFTAYGYVVNTDDEIEEYGLTHKYGETCIAIGLDDGEQKGWSQFLFLDYDEDNKICKFDMTDGNHYRFSNAFRSWIEMNEALAAEE